MIKLVAVPPSAVDAVWPRLSPIYEEACKFSRGKWTADAVRHVAESGLGQIWLAAESGAEVTATCLSQTAHFPGGLKMMLVELMGGSVKTDIFDFRATLEKQAKAEGCHAVFFLLPKKWAGRLPDYKISHILMCKELS